MADYESYDTDNEPIDDDLKDEDIRNDNNNEDYYPVKQNETPKYNKRTMNLMAGFDLSANDIRGIEEPGNKLYDLKCIRIRPNVVDRVFDNAYNTAFHEIRRLDTDNSLKEVMMILKRKNKNLDNFIQKNESRLNPYLLNLVKFFNDYLKIKFNLETKKKHCPYYRSKSFMNRRLSSKLFKTLIGSILRKLIER